MDIDILKSKSEVSPRPVRIDKLSVSFGSGVVSDFASSYSLAISSKMTKRVDISISSEEMESYLNFLLKTRVDQVSGNKVDRSVRMFAVPALFALALAHIGPCFDKEQGLDIIPVMDKSVKVISLDEAKAISMKLLLIEDFGFELVLGLPRDLKGDINFMLFHMAEGEILRHDRVAHPAYATLISFFRVNQIESLLSHRQSYGHADEHTQLLRSLIFDSVRAM